MTQYIDKSTVIAEIDRIQNTTMDKNKNFTSSYDEGKFDALTLLENYIDILEVKEIGVDLVDPKEEPASEGLEEAATKYAQDKYLPVQTAQSFKAGANWQKELIIDKAFKYINYQLNLPSDFEQHFRKAMEDKL